MNEEIEVQIARYKDRRNWIMRYVDPISGMYVSRSTEMANKSKTAKAAGKW